MDPTQAEATYNMAKTRLNDGFTSVGVDPKTLSPGFITALIQFLLTMIGGGCPPTPTPVPPATAAAQVKNALAKWPGYCELILLRQIRQQGMEKPLQSTVAVMHAANAATEPELTAFATLNSL